MNAKKLKNVLYTIAFPLAVYAVMELLCFCVRDRHVLSSMLDVQTIIRDTGSSAMIAFGLSLNLSSGRYDLSLGAQRLAGTIIGGVLALQLGLSGIWFLVFALLFGLLFGFLTGLAFVITRVPPMVLGVGIGLVWECFPYKISQGKGLNLFGVTGMEVINNTSFTIAVVIIVAAFIYILSNMTKFGYQMKAIQGSQLISQNSGINIFSHAVICYTLAGGLVCLAGMIDTVFTTQLTSSLGLASSGPINKNMFPMMLGGFIGIWTNQSIGVIVASLCVNLLSYGLITLELSEANSSVVNSVLFVLFLVFLANRYVLKNKRMEQERIALAKKRRRELAEMTAGACIW